MLASPSPLLAICVYAPLKYQFKDAEFVFVGYVKSFERDTGSMTVEEIFKGRDLGNGVTVRTESYGTSVDVTLKPGEKYLVLSRQRLEDGAIELSSCMSTGLVSQMDGEIQLLRTRKRWWASPVSYPGRWPLKRWFKTHF
jgi:hypothetical protein